MQGLGDNIHQRAVIAQIIGRGRDVWLTTPWPSVYFDFNHRLFLRPASSHLRTQSKNEIREAARYHGAEPPPLCDHLSVRYTPDGVRRHGSVVAAMLSQCGCDPTQYDFRFPALPYEWHRSIRPILDRARGCPILIYRPLVVRVEWGGCEARNPDRDAYAELLASFRSRFFLISIADLVPRFEWITSHPVVADLEFHHGELCFEHLAALFAEATLVYTAQGFAGALAQAVGTASITVFGGYENSSSISLGARLSPTLAIDPIQPCNCWRHDHSCKKAIDIPAAIRRIEDFINAIADYQQGRDWGVANRTQRLANALHEPGGAGSPDRSDATGPAPADGG